MAYPPRPRLDTTVSRHWATLLTPSPSPELPSPKTSNASLSSSPSSAGPRTGTVSLPPLRTAVPLAKLDSYRRAKDNSVSPIQEMLFQSKPPLSAQPKTTNGPSPTADRAQGRSVPFYFPPRSHHTPSAAGGRPVLARLTTDLYSSADPLSHLKSPRKRADPGQLGVLNRAFARSPYPSTEERDRLSRRLGMTSRSVQIWFQNKRRSVKVHEESIKQRYVSAPY